MKRVKKLAGSRQYPTMTSEELKKKWQTQKSTVIQSSQEYHKEIDNHHLRMPSSITSFLQQDTLVCADVVSIIVSYYGGFHPSFNQYLTFQRDFIEKKRDCYLFSRNQPVFSQIFNVRGLIDEIYVLDPNKPSEVMIVEYKQTKNLQKSNRFAKGVVSFVSHLDDCNHIHYSLIINVLKSLLEQQFPNLRAVKMMIVCIHFERQHYEIEEVSPLSQTLISTDNFPPSNKY